MRISKHSRSWATAGRRLFRERLKSHEPKENAVSEAGNTLREHKAEPDTTAFAPPPQPIANADPTQRLLTVLGRFNRFVSLAEMGNAPEHWSDDCMEQLINGIEIAIEETWVDVKRALTDTARILQSYENVGSPESALPFLKKSYETLCLMVGDLIVGNVRSGVLEKWKTLYAEAVAELQRAGVPLVDDDGGNNTTGVAEMQTESDAPAVEETVGTVEAQENAPAFFEDDPFGNPSTQAEDEPVENGADPAFSDLPFDMPGEFESVSDVSDETPQYGEFMTGGVGVEDAQETSGTPEESAEAETAEAGDAFDSDDVEDAAYDAVPQHPATVEVVEENQGEPEAEPEQETPTSEQELLASLPPLPDDFTANTPDETAMTESAGEFEETQETSPSEIPETEGTTPIADEGEGAASLAEDEPQQPAAVSAEDDQTGTADMETQASAEPEDPASMLLRITNEALVKGDVGEAKITALQLAAQMAALEQERAEEKVAKNHHELDRILAAIREGDTITQQAEQRLLHNTQKLREHESGIHERKTEIETLQKQVAKAEARMTALDEEIRKLEEKRADEAQLGAELQADMEMAIYTEGQLKQELSQLAESEQTARVALEQAQKHVAHLHQNRERQESLIAEAETEVQRQHKSLEDIRHTINLVLGIVPEEPETAEGPPEGAPEAEAGTTAQDIESPAETESENGALLQEKEIEEAETEMVETSNDIKADSAKNESQDNPETDWEERIEEDAYTEDEAPDYPEDDIHREQCDYDAYEDADDEGEVRDWENTQDSQEASGDAPDGDDGQQELF